MTNNKTTVLILLALSAIDSLFTIIGLKHSQYPVEYSQFALEAAQSVINAILILFVLLKLENKKNDN